MAAQRVGPLRARVRDGKWLTTQIAYKVHGTVQGVGFRYDILSGTRWTGLQRERGTVSARICITDQQPRDFTQKRATEYGLKGWVKNTTDGMVCLKLAPVHWTGLTDQVEGEAEGPSELMRSFVETISKGPRMAHVSKLEQKEITPLQSEVAYTVRRTSDSVVSFD